MKEQERQPQAASAQASAEEAPTVRRLPSEPLPGPGEAPTWMASSGPQEKVPPPLTPGQLVVGRYTVLDLLGQGGMGAVLAAYDSRLDRRVALKLLLRTPGTSGTHGEDSRLMREAQAMARLNHPHVVAVYDSGTLEDGSLFIAMEYVQGQTLRQWRARQPRTWREVLQAYLAAGRGLAAAHAAGLIHRDFKPDNVLVGEDGRVRVTDFGLARAHSTPTSPERPSSPAPVPSASGASGSLSSALTLQGSFMGTPGYMAPELVQGRTADVRSDVFAFCAALYEALYELLPFRGATATELTRAHLDGKVAPPPASSEVPAWVTRTVMRGLHADPAQRPASLEELLTALQDDPEVKRRARLRTGALAALMGLLVALAAWGWTRQQAQAPVCGQMEKHLAGIWDEPSKARVREALMGTGLPSAEHAFTGVAGVLDTYAGAWVKQRTALCESLSQQASPLQGLAVRQEYCLERRRSQLQALTELLARGSDRELVFKAVQAAQALPPLEYCADAKALAAAVPPPEDLTVRARVETLQTQVDRMEALQEAGKHQEGLKLGAELLKQVEPLGYAPLHARTLILMTFLRENAGDFKAAEATVRQALVQASRGKDLIQTSKAVSILAALVGYRQGRHQEALLLEPVVEAAAELADEDLTRALAQNNMAMVYTVLGKYPEAQARFERALELRRKVRGPEHIEVANAINNLGGLLQMMDRSEEGLEHIERSAALRQKVLGPEHPLVAGSLNNLGLMLHYRGRYAEALEKLERALAIREQVLGPEHADAVATLNLLGSLLVDLGRYEEARERLERALTLREKALGPDHQLVAVSRDNLADALTGLGRYAEAQQHYERALAVREKAFGKDHPDSARSHQGLGELELARGRPEAAIPPFERALALSHQRDRSLAQFGLAQALWASGRERSRAVELATQALEHWRQLGHQPKVTEVSGWLATHNNL